jgi:hypothetical protein
MKTGQKILYHTIADRQYLYVLRPRNGNYRGGQTIIAVAVFFLLISMTIITGVATPVIGQVNQSKNFVLSRQSFSLARAASEDVAYRIKTGLPVGAVNIITLDGQSATATSSAVFDGQQIIASGQSANLIRTVKTHLANGNGVAFHYGVQSGAGGVTLNNTSSITGNLYSNGPVSGGGNLIRGDVVSAGPNGSITNIHATSSAYAHTITNSTIDKNAYYQTISNSTVHGTLYPGSADEATTSLPIPDSQIASWEAAAAGGGVINSCPYSITSNVTIGPKKINCDLSISNGATVTLTGPIWAVGNIAFRNSSEVKVSPSLGNQSVAMIADNPANRSSEGRITVSNGMKFFGSGGANSYVLLISQNNSAENQGGVKAIDVANSVSGALLIYAGHGKVSLANSVSLKEVTAYQLELKNSAEVIYQSGLANLLFSAGPSGGFNLDSTREIP